MPGAPPSAGTTTPESSANAGKPLASAARRAFSSAFSSNVAPVSSGSMRPSSAAPTASTSYGASNSRISTILPGLWLAMTSLPPENRRAMLEPECGALAAGQLGDAGAGQRQHRVEARLVERCTLGGRLDLDDAARPGQHEIGVGLGIRILGVIEVEHRNPLEHPAGNRRDAVVQRHFRQQTGGDEALKGLVEGDIAAGDRGGAGAAIGLDHVAIDADLPLAHRGEVGHRPQAAADQALDFLGPAALPAARRLAVGAGVG